MESVTTTDVPNGPERCILHVEQQHKAKKQRQDVLPFGEKQWAAIQMAVQNRTKKREFNDSLYYAVVQRLPDKPSPCDGYHVHCYKNFTAVPSPETFSEPHSPESSRSNTLHLRSEATAAASSTSSVGIFQQTCLFCRKHKKRSKKGSIELVGACETMEACRKIQEAADTLKDKKILAQVAGVDLIAKEAKYHHSCKSAYLLMAGRSHSKDGQDKKRPDISGSSVAIEHILNYIEQSVIVDRRPELLTSVYEQYLDMCLVSGEEPIQIRSLGRNLTQKFKNRIKMQCLLGNKSGNVIFSSETAEDAIRVAYDYTSTDERIITKAAMILRNHLLSVKPEKSDDATLEDLREGDSSPPEIVINFFTSLFGGLSNKMSERVKRRANSASQDALFIVQSGRVKPAKHVALGTSVKSITGSKKLVNVLNRFGHCLNYNTLEELETKTAESILEKETACPEGTIKLSPMGLAFDNFDELTQTLSGMDTLHDTMGILYQNIPQVPMEPVNSASSSRPTSKKSITKNPQKKSNRKRSLEAVEMPLEPYRGIPKMTDFNYKNLDVFNLPDVSLQARHLDLAWMMNHALGNEMLPMWVGFNATVYKDNLPRQEVRYMPNLQQPITGLDVVQETLNITQRCAKECNQQYGIVTYDLNAAKPAMKIQTTQKPKYDDVFIMPGAFHVEMAFFKAIGKLISGSGGPEMLTESDVLASGSLNGFLTGKHFNRCKRLHPILALAFEILHFMSFLETYEHKDQTETLMDNVQPNREDGLQEMITSDVFIECANAYEAYTEETRSGKHGCTARFWMMYIDYIRQYHQLERSIRTNDIDLYIYSLTGITDLFFAANHVNYCRWLTKFQLDLLNIEDSHPGLRQILEQGAFTIRRTDHPFSRCPVDLTLEQTINADAASRRTGITSSTNNFGARHRWMITKSTRASFISLLQEMAGLAVKEDTTAELRPARIKRDAEDLDKVIKQIKDSCNPFDREREPAMMLYNIHTGKATSQVVKQSLLNVPENGRSRHAEFINSCKNDSARFEAPISKAQLKTFSDEGVTNRRTTNNKVAALKCTRDLMGRLLVVASTRELDLQHIFEYPLTPVPLSMCNPDETMAKTDKSKLLKLLEEKQQKSETSPQINAYIVDGQYLLHTLPPNLPPTYGGFARSILLQALALSHVRVHIVFDDYPQPSLKDAERSRRGASAEDSRSYAISGPAQRRPRDLRDALKSRSFKKELPAFLAKEWTDPSYRQIIQSCDVYLDVPGGECFHFYVKDGEVSRDAVEILATNHEEADTKICVHALAADSSNSSIAVRASDTDIAVILLHHSDKFSGTLLMDVGTTSRNDRRFINITSISKALGRNMCAALPGFHAFTGSDYTSAFVQKGKQRPFAKLQNDLEVQKAFKDMASGTSPSSTYEEIILKYTAVIYGAKKATTTLNKCRFQAFEKAYRPKSTGKNPLEKLKGIDASSIPPCESEVITHIKRAAFVARMWSHADKVHINQHPTENDGWEMVEGVYAPIWFEGDQIPATMVPEDSEMEENDCDDGLEAASSDEEEGLSDDDENIE